ncbi:MAG: prenyltransferase/squalene oxidase repeat-containing protein [Planctomycetota bacterium]|nr:prenyltransferase/squalene oxidase repeat-containing protein [Planctomycetota bacterium]
MHASQRVDRIAFCSPLKVTAFVLALAMTTAPHLLAAESAETNKTRTEAVDRGVKYLLASGAKTDGQYTPRTGIGVTALVATSLLRSGVLPTEPTLAKSLKFIEANVREDGGIYSASSRMKNYETCLGVVCLSEANKDGKYDRILKHADKFLKGLQIDERDGKGKDDQDFGGVGYGGKGRPDLSNTAFMLEALAATGNGPDDEAVRKALIFVSRCQNLDSEHNTGKIADKINDGGFNYTAVGDEEPEDTKADGGLRSQGSMSYAGLKSMIYVGLKPDDVRVKAATEWLKKNYDLQSNPGLGSAGLYYYYHLMAKALDAVGDKDFVDANGKSHDWKADLVEELAKRQQKDGSWKNSNERWLEADPNLVTGYALLTLSFCK